MSGFRARDEDRDRVVEVIEAAYVDGQLGAEDRELRVTRALSAASLDELEGLTRDLQVPAAPDVVRPLPGQPAARERPRRLVGGLVALGAWLVLLGVGVASVSLLAVGSDPDSATSTAVESAPAVPAPPAEGTVVEESEAAAFEMTPGRVRRFLRLYEEEFGTLDSFQAVFYPARVSMEVPVRGSRPRYERWSYDGTWRRDAAASAVTGLEEIVDLGSVDVSRLFDNITTARRTLGVQRGELTHVVVHQVGDAAPTVNIYIGNTFSENGYLMTTMSGDVIRRFPYEP